MIPLSFPKNTIDKRFEFKSILNNIFINITFRMENRKEDLSVLYITTKMSTSISQLTFIKTKRKQSNISSLVHKALNTTK